mmetsp:Transcript_71427/g.157966  ORF Transcript_71427/g.157966 Transcript_71427/m.157966 type:complete len:500 (-) Transcript_71427:1184-2683(-)
MNTLASPESIGESDLVGDIIVNRPKIFSKANSGWEAVDRSNHKREQGIGTWSTNSRPCGEALVRPNFVGEDFVRKARSCADTVVVSIQTRQGLLCAPSVCIISVRNPTAVLRRARRPRARRRVMCASASRAAAGRAAGSNSLGGLNNGRSGAATTADTCSGPAEQGLGSGPRQGPELRGAGHSTAHTLDCLQANPGGEGALEVLTEAPEVFALTTAARCRQAQLYQPSGVILRNEGLHQGVSYRRKLAHERILQGPQSGQACWLRRCGRRCGIHGQGSRGSPEEAPDSGLQAVLAFQLRLCGLSLGLLRLRRSCPLFGNHLSQALPSPPDLLGAHSVGRRGLWSGAGRSRIGGNDTGVAVGKRRASNRRPPRAPQDDLQSPTAHLLGPHCGLALRSEVGQEAPSQVRGLPLYPGAMVHEVHEVLRLPLMHLLIILAFLQQERSPSLELLLADGARGICVEVGPDIIRNVGGEAQPLGGAEELGEAQGATPVLVHSVEGV